MFIRISISFPDIRGTNPVDPRGTKGQSQVCTKGLRERKGQSQGRSRGSPNHLDDLEPQKGLRCMEGKFVDPWFWGKFPCFRDDFFFEGLVGMEQLKCLFQEFFYFYFCSAYLEPWGLGTIWSKYSDLTRPGPSKGSFWEGKWDPLFQGN